LNSETPGKFSKMDEFEVKTEINSTNEGEIAISSTSSSGISY